MFLPFSSIKFATICHFLSIGWTDVNSNEKTMKKKKRWWFFPQGGGRSRREAWWWEWWFSWCPKMNSINSIDLKQPPPPHLLSLPLCLWCLSSSISSYLPTFVGSKSPFYCSRVWNFCLVSLKASFYYIAQLLSAAVVVKCYSDCFWSCGPGFDTCMRCMFCQHLT